MERPLNCLNNLAQNDWLLDYNSRQFNQIAQELYLELTQLSASGIPPKIILVEREPLRFLASFIAACAANCSVFLCNPDWGTQEWQQVFDLVKPDIIWGIGNREWGVANRLAVSVAEREWGIGNQNCEEITIISPSSPSSPTPHSPLPTPHSS